MLSMLLTRAGAGVLERTERGVPAPSPSQVLVRVDACAVCRTDLHVVDGELPDPHIPLIPGHEIVGTVERVGSAVAGFAAGERVGIPWLGYTCGRCGSCLSDRENLCPNARFTGYQLDGGYADTRVADARYVFPIPVGYSAAEAAPLLCAGLIGYRSYRMAGDGRRLGLYGFGAAAHIIAQVARYDGREVYAFTSPGDTAAQDFARQLGARWAGSSTERRRAARRGDHLRARGTTRASGSCPHETGRHRRLRGHSHERYPDVSVSSSVAGARRAIGGEPHAPRRTRVPHPRTRVPVKTHIRDTRFTMRTSP